jgi:uncharacterized protein
MKVAVIGGGASGMVTAYLLDRKGHEVTVFERQSILGGHIRTLNKNIQHQTSCPEFLEAGVLEFPVEFKQFIGLMDELGVELEPVQVGSGLFFQDLRHFLSQVAIDRNFTGWKRWREILQIDGLYARSAGLWLKMQFATIAKLRNMPLSAYFKSEYPRATWIKLLAMYSYSMPYGSIDDFPAEMAIPSLRRYVFTDWVRIKGGVYSYIEKILDRFHGNVILNAQIKDVFRQDSGVEIVLADDTIQLFGAVVFATPPDQVLKLLSDPSDNEIRRFANWQANYAETIMHSDTALYEPYGVKQGSEFDFFQTESVQIRSTQKPDWGYNAVLNQLCGVRDELQYSLAFNLRSRIDPNKIIHIQEHHTPRYTVDAFRTRSEIIATNGDQQTYYVGAYLGDGLHEGAVASAQTVAEAIGTSKETAAKYAIHWVSP